MNPSTSGTPAVGGSEAPAAIDSTAQIAPAMDPARVEEWRQAVVQERKRAAPVTDGSAPTRATDAVTLESLAAGRLPSRPSGRWRTS